MKPNKILSLVFLCSLFSFSAFADEAIPLPKPAIPDEQLTKNPKPPSSSRLLASNGNSPAMARAALPSTDDFPWYRDAGEYLTSRSTRMGVPTETNTLVNTDGKRFDVSIGKRIPLLSWSEVSSSEAWFLGVDGGVLASLDRSKRNNQLVFATNTFDGFFGGFIGYGAKGWLAMLRVAHLSAHLVDNSPQILSPISYSQFWNEFIVGKTFPDPETISRWDLHFQASVGLNHTSQPANKQPRASFGSTFGYGLKGPDSLAIVTSADILRAGVQGQKPSYVLFLGLGTLNRPNSTIRPFRVGVAHFTGSDYRNQYYNRKQKWTTFQVAAEF